MNIDPFMVLLIGLTTVLSLLTIGLSIYLVWSGWRRWFANDQERQNSSAFSNEKETEVNMNHFTTVVKQSNRLI